MDKQSKTKRHLIGFGVVALAVAGGLWFFDNHVAQGKDIPAEALVVDVRTPGEFAGGHYDRAVNIPLGQLRGRLAELGAKDRQIIVYCQTGSRSRTAQRLLQRAGYTTVEDGGGIARMRRRKRARPAAMQSTKQAQ